MELFVGRAAQIEEIRRYARQACTGKLESVFLSGERGIGKSSLSRFVKERCEKECDMLGVHVSLCGVNTLEELVRRVFEQLLKEAYLQSWFYKIKPFFGNCNKEAGLFGVSGGFSPTEDQLRALVRGFPTALNCICEAFQGDKKGIIIILDDMDGLADQAELANWYKNLVDNATIQQWRLPVMVVFSGIPERRDSLVHIQPSLQRIFRVVEIEQLSDPEVEQFFRLAFRAADVSVGPLPLKLMVQSCSGFPALMHEIGDAVFWADAEGIVDESDAVQGIRKAAEEVGKKYFSPLAYRAIRDIRYCAVLEKIADSLDLEFHEHDVAKKLDDHERMVFHHFLAEMRRLGVLEADRDCDHGTYRFGNRLFPIYLRMANRDQPCSPHAILEPCQTERSRPSRSAAG